MYEATGYMYRISSCRWRDKGGTAQKRAIKLPDTLILRNRPDIRSDICTRQPDICTGYPAFPAETKEWRHKSERFEFLTHVYLEIYRISGQIYVLDHRIYVSDILKDIQLSLPRVTAATGFMDIKKAGSKRVMNLDPSLFISPLHSLLFHPRG